MHLILTSSKFCSLVKSLPNDKILDLSISKEFADKNSNVKKKIAWEG